MAGPRSAAPPLPAPPLRRVEPVVPVLLGLHGLATSLSTPVPAWARVAFVAVVLAGLVGLVGAAHPHAVVARGALCTAVAFAVQVSEPSLVGAMLHWYYSVVAVYALLVPGWLGAAVGPVVASCLVAQVALGSQPAPLSVAVLRAAVLAALGALLWSAGNRYRFERQRADEGRAAAERANLKLAHAATHDDLTGLPNRSRLREAIGTALAHRGQDGVAVLILDADRFKTINDLFGHEAGDALLVDLAERVSSLAGDAETARLGGDEFALVVPGPVSVATDTAQRLVDGFRTPFTVQGRDHTLTVSIGIAHDRAGRASTTELLRAADVALYSAKDRGRDRWAVYDEAMTEHARTLSGLEQRLRAAIREHAVDVAYQPVVDLSTGEVTGVEALARWTSNGSPAPPDVFVALAEDTGLIDELGTHVLTEAVSAVARWRDSGAFAGYVAVNVSPLQLQSPGFLDLLDRVVAENRIDPSCLVLELTESAVAAETYELWNSLDGIHARGFRLALDDFGTGYSSLARLQRLPVSILKIDRSFVDSLTADAGFVRLVVGLAQQLGLDTVAEGVEDLDQLAILRDAGCRLGQGWVWARALPEPELLALLDAAGQARTRDGGRHPSIRPAAASAR